MMTPLLKSCAFSLRLNGCTGTKFVLILYYRSQRFHVNFDVKKVLVCRLSIGFYFSKSKLDHIFFWALKHKYLARRTLRW